MTMRCNKVKDKEENGRRKRLEKKVKMKKKEMKGHE